MDDNGLPPLPGTQSTGSPPSPSASEGQSSDQSSGTVVPEPVVSAPVDNVILPPLPVPGDTVSPAISDTVTQESSVKQEPPTTLPPSEPEKPKKKSNMKVVAGLMVALFLIGSAVTSLVMFPNFRGDIRPKAREVEEVEQYTEEQNQRYGYELTDLQRTQFQNPDNDNPYAQVTFAPVEDNNYAGDGAQVQWSPPSTGGGGGSQSTGSTEDNNYSGGGTGPYCSSEMNRDCTFGCSPSSTGGSCNSAPVATTTVVTAPSISTGGNGCAGIVCPDGRRCVPDTTTGYDCVDPTVTTAPGVGGTGGGPTATVTSTVTSTPGAGGGGTCEGAQNASCCAGKSPGQVTCGGSVGYCTRGTSGCSFDFAKICIPNECYHTGTGDEGRLCASDGLGYVANTTCYANPTVWTCGCDLGDEAGSVGPQTCWNKETGGSVKKEPFISGCKGSGAPSVTTSVTASVTTGGGSSGGGSSSSSSGGSSSSSSSSSGGVTAMCVETRVYLKKADGTFDTVATPVSQLSSKVSIGNTIRLAIRGNLANFTKGRFIIKKDGTVLETKETTTKNNLPGDPATFEYIYDYTVASGGSYSIEGAVWQ